MACQDAERRGSYPSQPSIKNVETRLDWWAHQIDMPQGWMELIAFQAFEDARKLAWKIQALRSKVTCPQVPHLEHVSSR